MTKFFTPDLFPEPKVDKAYINNRESEYAEDTRQWLEQAWYEYQEYCPESPIEFIKDAQLDFESAVWQMLLTVLIKRQGHQLIKPREVGPDIIVSHNGRRILIEAVAAKVGDGKDRVVPLSEKPFKEIMPGVKSYQVESREFPDRKTIFRIQNSFANKVAQFARWQELGLIEPTDSYIIAVNGFQVDDLGSPDKFSYGVRAIFAVGAQVFSIPVNLKTGQADSSQVTSHLQHQPSVQKQSGFHVESDCFMTDRFKQVSGLIYTHQYFNEIIEREAKGIALVRNPFAQMPIQSFSLGFGQEFEKLDDPNGQSYRIESKNLWK